MSAAVLSHVSVTSPRQIQVAASLYISLTYGAAIVVVVVAAMVAGVVLTATDVVFGAIEAGVVAIESSGVREVEAGAAVEEHASADRTLVARRTGSLRML